MMYLESYYVGRANFKTAIKYDPGVQTIYDDYIAMKGPSAPSYVTMMRAFIFNNTRLDGSMIQVSVIFYWTLNISCGYSLKMSLL